MITVVAEQGRLQRHLTHLDVQEEEGVTEIDIVIPDTVLEGEVVNVRGEPVSDAQVTASQYGKLEIPVLVTSDTEGRFFLEGMPAGMTSLEAQTVSSRSEPVLVSMTEGEQTEARLVVQEIVQLRGQVLGPSGGIPGARIMAFPLGLSPNELRATTDISGAFTMQVPQWASQLSTMVMAPGYGMRAMRLSVQPDPIEIPVNQSAGTLVIKLDGQDRLIVLMHNQVVIALPLLEIWAAMNGLPRHQSGQLVIPSMEAGDYSLCALQPADLTALFAGALPGDARADPRTLYPGVELVLDLQD